MTAARPYETDPFHPPSSVHILTYYQFLYIFENVPVISTIWYVQLYLDSIQFISTLAHLHSHLPILMVCFVDLFLVNFLGGVGFGKQTRK